MIHLTIGVLLGLAVGAAFFAFSVRPIWNSFGTWQPAPPTKVLEYVFVFFKLIWGAIWRLLVLAIVGLVLGYFVAHVRGKIDKIPQADQVSKELRLVALRNSSALGGQFFLGSGRFREEDYYEFFYEYDSGFVKDRINASRNLVVVYEEDRPDGVLQFFTCKETTPTPKITSFWSERIAIQGSCKRFHRYEFHIPRGSIVRNMKLE